MTDLHGMKVDFCIIPYQELLGNYDNRRKRGMVPSIIPYQELLGNYDRAHGGASSRTIIPYQELLGNYDSRCYKDFTC